MHHLQERRVSVQWNDFEPLEWSISVDLQLMIHAAEMVFDESPQDDYYRQETGRKQSRLLHAKCGLYWSRR